MAKRLLPLFCCYLKVFISGRLNNGSERLTLNNFILLASAGSFRNNMGEHLTHHGSKCKLGFLFLL
jgi:hypothetical protein